MTITLEVSKCADCPYLKVFYGSQYGEFDGTVSAVCGVSDERIISTDALIYDRLLELIGIHKTCPFLTKKED